MDNFLSVDVMMTDKNVHPLKNLLDEMSLYYTLQFALYFTGVCSILKCSRHCSILKNKIQQIFNTTPFLSKLSKH